MANQLTPSAPLEGFARQIGENEIAEVTKLCAVSLAVSKGNEKAFASAVKKTWNLSLPDVEQLVEKEDSRRLLWMAQDQYLLLHESDDLHPVKTAKKDLGETAWMTDQSDANCALRCSGPQTLAALERICPLNLSLEAFPISAVKRTAMEHLGVVIIREAEDQFLLVCARSSAASFLYAIETSFENVV